MPGGHLCIVDPLGETYSFIGNKKYKMFPLVYGDILKSFKDAGFQVVQTEQHSFCNDDKYYVDSNKWHMTVGRKF